MDRREQTLLFPELATSLQLKMTPKFPRGKGSTKVWTSSKFGFFFLHAFLKHLNILSRDEPPEMLSRTVLR